MTIKQLIDVLNQFDTNLEVMTKKTEILGNVGFVNSARLDTYGFFGADLQCVLLTDEYEAEEGEEV